jgi:hypothetical protein
MSWEQRFCSDRRCTSETWVVRRDCDLHDVWSAAPTEEEHPFIVAATTQVCPRCGTTLQTREECASADASRDVGSVFDYMRSLR